MEYGNRDAEGAKGAQKSQKKYQKWFWLGLAWLGLVWFGLVWVWRFHASQPYPRHSRAGGNPQQRTIKGMDSRLRGNDGNKRQALCGNGDNAAGSVQE